MGGPPVTRCAARARLAARLPGVGGARRLEPRPAPTPRCFPTPSRGLRAPSPLYPLHGLPPGRRDGLRRGGEAGEDGAAMVPQPFPGAQDGRAERGGKARRARGLEPGRPGAARLFPWAAALRPRPPPPAAHAAFVTVCRPTRGCKWQPLAPAPPAARPARGRRGHSAPVRIPPRPLPGSQISLLLRFRPRLRYPSSRNYLQESLKY